MNNVSLGDSREGRNPISCVNFHYTTNARAFFKVKVLLKLKVEKEKRRVLVLPMSRKMGISLTTLTKVPPP